MPLRMSRTIWQALRHLASIGTLVLVLILAGIYLDKQWKDIEAYTSEIQWDGISLAVIGFTLGMALLPLSSWLILRYSGFQPSVRQVWRIFYWSQVAKYLPGSIWSLPSRVYFYTQIGIPVSQSAAIVLWETALIIMGAAVLVVVFPSLVFGASFLPVTLLAFVALIAIVQGMAHVLAMPRFKAWANTGTKFKQPLAVMVAFVPAPRQMLILTSTYALTWMVIGLAFAQTAHSVIPVPRAGDWFDLAALHAGAWIVGFLVVFAPGGIGVKDALLVFGAEKLFDTPSPVIIAGLARLLWTAAELIGLLFMQVINRLRPSSQRTCTPEE